MKILVSYRGIPQSPGWATGDLVVRALSDLGHEVYPYAKYYQKNNWVRGFPTSPHGNIISLDSHDWDLILYMECNDGDAQYHELQITRARKTACWLFDTSYHQDRYKKLVDYFNFDYIFLANPLTIQEYKIWGYTNVHYLPYACDREIHERSLEYSKTRDVVLVGSIRDDRVTLVNKLKNNGVNIELIGGMFREEYINTLASAKIVINQNPPEGRGLLNMRHFEAQAAGSFLIEQHEDIKINSSMHNSLSFFPCFTDEIPEICHDILEDWDNELACQIKQKSHDDFLKHHTYKNRCQEILNKIFSYERN